MEATKIKMKLWDGKWIKNFSGENTDLTLELKETTFTAYANCTCDRLEGETEIYHNNEHYLWKGEYKKIAVTALELVSKLKGLYQLQICVNGVSDDVVIVFDDLKEANQFYKTLKIWLGW